MFTMYVGQDIPRQLGRYVIKFSVSSVRGTEVSARDLVSNRLAINKWLQALIIHFFCLSCKKFSPSTHGHIGLTVERQQTTLHEKQVHDCDTCIYMYS